MSLFVSKILEPQEDSEATTGWVGSFDDGLDHVVVCRWEGEDWKPLYGLQKSVNGYVPFSLPQCFRLAEDAAYALSAALEEANKTEGDDDGEQAESAGSSRATGDRRRGRSD